MKVDWTKAPKWAKWWSYSAYSRLMVWHSHKPTYLAGINVWGSDHGTQNQVIGKQFLGGSCLLKKRPKDV